MSLTSENVIPGNHGKIFETNASKDEQMDEIQAKVVKIKGVKDVLLVKDVFPRQFIVHTTELVKIEEIEKAVNELKLHAIPKGFFSL